MSTDRTFPIGSYCASTVWGGLEMNVLRFLVWMRDRGWPVFLYADPESPLAQHAVEARVPLRQIRVSSEITAILFSGRLAKLTKTDDLRALIMHQSRDLLVCALAKQRGGGRLRLIYSQNMHLGNKRDLLHAWQYRNLDAFVAPLPILAEQARRQTVVPPERIKIIPHGIDQGRFSIRLNRAESRRQLDLPPEPTVIGLIGRLDPKKGQHTAIAALARCHAKGSPAHLLIVGDPTLNENDGYADRLHGLVDHYKLREFVHFRPHLEQPELAYAAMDIFVMASQSETYGLVTIEAMTSGLPVIGTDSGGTVNLIEHERNGLRFRPDDDAGLADALMRYMADPTYATRMAAQGRADALARYSHVRQCEEWEKLLRAL